MTKEQSFDLADAYVNSGVQDVLDQLDRGRGVPQVDGKPLVEVARVARFRRGHLVGKR